MLWALVVAGGRGTRFWPESRENRPKQFLNLFGAKTLLEQTLSRITPLIPRSRILIITQQDKAALVRRLSKIPAAQVIGEPVGRNTAPCVVLGASLVLRRDPQAVIAILPADHLIRSPKAFHRALRASAEKAFKTSRPVTFGVKPSFAFTGYGYIEKGKASGRGFYGVKGFFEKPDERRARYFFRSKRFLWNSGMFIWKAGDILKTARELLPKAYDVACRISRAHVPAGMKRYYASMPNISVDYAFMEKMRGEILTLPVDFGWSDVGGWQAWADLLPRDAGGNVISGSALLVDSQGNIVKAGKRLVALIGMRDHLIVDTPDALLVCPKNRAEDIRRAVKLLAGSRFSHLC